MEDSDIVQLEDLDAVRRATGRSARRALLVAALAIPAAAAIAFALVYFLYGSDRLAVGYVLAAVIALLAAYQLARWRRHYRSINEQLDALQIRVKNGERVLGSQVRFHSYR